MSGVGHQVTKQMTISIHVMFDPETPAFYRCNREGGSSAGTRASPTSGRLKTAHMSVFMVPYGLANLFVGVHDEGTV